MLGNKVLRLLALPADKSTIADAKRAALWNETVTWKDVYNGYANLRVQVWEVISHFFSPRMRKQKEL